MASRTLTRKIPAGDGKRFNWIIPVDSKGRPNRKSAAWKELIVSVVSRNVDERTPAEKACLRLEMK
jgi:hypothetical protein